MNFRNLFLVSCFVYFAASQGLNPICTDSQYRQGLLEGGCVRYVKGWDITGSTTAVYLRQEDGINNACDCMLACKNRADTCASWVWKYSDLSTPYRTCGLNSDFNLPSAVFIDMNANTSQNLGEFSNPHFGGKAPRCTTEQNTPDDDCVSGALWYLDNGYYLC